MGKNISGKYKQWAMREVYDPNIRQGRIYAKKTLNETKKDILYHLKLQLTIKYKSYKVCYPINTTTS